MHQQASLQGCEALYSYIESSNSFYQELLGYKPEQTSLQEISSSEWARFARQRELGGSSRGIYFPRSQKAIVQKGNPLSLFHEYFGHGLYCESSLEGIKLVNLERKLLGEEKNEFEGKEFSIDDLNHFRGQNQTFQDLITLREKNLANYEFFAIWTEYLLSKELGFRDNFERRYLCFSEEEKEGIGSIINFSKNYGNLATFYGFGLKRELNKSRLTKLSQNIFGKKLKRTPLILHFGSKKPFSDIDLFVVSNDIPPSYDSWLDVRTNKPSEIISQINVLNPMVTDPLMVGSLILGEEEYLRELKRKILAQPITEEAINFSLIEYEREMKVSKDSSLGKYLQHKNLRSAKTFLTNAFALKNGDKVLTFSGLVDYSRKKFSHDAKFIELEGGIE